MTNDKKSATEVYEMNAKLGLVEPKKDRMDELEKRLDKLEKERLALNALREASNIEPPTLSVRKPNTNQFTMNTSLGNFTVCCSETNQSAPKDEIQLVASNRDSVELSIENYDKLKVNYDRVNNAKDTLVSIRYSLFTQCLNPYSIQKELNKAIELLERATKEKK